MRILYISDLHFNHYNIIRYENRPFKDVEEMNRELVKRWNNKVNDEDHVYILGDVGFFNSTTKTIDLVRKLKGHKHLILGNHDTFARKAEFRYNNDVFESIDDYLEIKDNERLVCMFHYPICCWDRQHYNSYHLFGHLHSNMDLLPEFMKNNSHCFNVGADINSFEPQTLDELIKRHYKKKYA